METRDLIVIGGSAGSLPALQTLTAALPQWFSASVLVAVHSPKLVGSTLHGVLHRGSRLPVMLPSGSTAFARSRIYIVPGGMQAHVESRRLRVVEAAAGDRFRPSIDTLFRTAAQTYGERVIGVVLSGVLNDGAAGLAAIVRAGGVGIVQSPVEAPFAEMPLSAQRAAPESYCLPVGQIVPLLVELVGAPVSPALPAWARVAVGE